MEIYVFEKLNNIVFSLFINNVCRFRELKEQHERQLLNGEPQEKAEGMMVLDTGTMEDLSLPRHENEVQDLSTEPDEDSKSPLLDVGDAEKEEDTERSRSTDETSHRTRSKRESRRMRELEQAQFSLELLKVRTTSVGGGLPEDSIPGSVTCQLDDCHRQSPRGSLASHGSFELLSVEDMETEGSGDFGSQLTVEEHSSLEMFQPEIHPLHEGLRDSNYNEKAMMDSPIKEEAPRATFFIASDQSPVQEPKFDSPSKSYKERRESTSRRPVVVVISMQKESPVEECELQAAQALERASQMGVMSSSSHLTSTAGLEVELEKELPPRTTTEVTRELSEGDTISKVPSSTTHEAPGICSSEVDIQIIMEPKTNVPEVPPSQQERRIGRPAKEASSPILETKPPKAQKKSSAQTVIVNMMEKPSNAVFSPPRRKLPFSK